MSDTHSPSEHFDSLAAFERIEEIYVTNSQPLAALEDIRQVALEARLALRCPYVGCMFPKHGDEHPCGVPLVEGCRS